MAMVALATGHHRRHSQHWPTLSIIVDIPDRPGQRIAPIPTRGLLPAATIPTPTTRATGATPPTGPNPQLGTW